MIDDRPNLPQLEPTPFLTDSGLETTLIFNEGVQLPSFAAFVLLQSADGRHRLRRYFERHAEIARDAGCGFIAEAPTWRANPDWGRSLGYDSHDLDEINKSAITFLADLRDRDGWDRSNYVISGCIGPRGDGYDPRFQISAEEAERYHAEQIASFAATEADLVSALTLTNVDEAIGITRAAQNAGMPVVISFTLETDGRLPVGHTARRSDPPRRCAHRSRSRLLHDQLRAPNALRACPRRWRWMARPVARHPRKRLAQEPRGARRRHRSRRRRSLRARQRVRLTGG